MRIQKWITKFLDITFWKFILVGIVNTLVGTTVMFVFYNVFHLDYWISTAANYVVGSIVSYFLNKHYTFKSSEKSPKVVVRFVINISVCYFIAYGVARNAVSWVLQSAEAVVRDNCAMLVGMGLFVILNYIGQRFWTFKEN